ncbi:MAG TPA: gliding motility-associated protein GldE [Flavobacterium sp.]|nr:gliding motility-associated protein GldE [Flavobacterium sp.]
MDPEPCQYALLLHSNYGVAIAILLLLLSLLLVILYSAAEVAYFSISKSDYEEMDSFKNVKKSLQKILAQPIRLQSTITSGIIISKVLFLLALGGIKFLWLDMIFIPQISWLIYFLIGVLIITCFGELISRFYAYEKNEIFIVKSIRFIEISNFVLSPLTYPFRQMGKWMKVSLDEEENSFSVEELSQALEMTDYSHTTEEEQKILEGIASFGYTEAYQVMTPRIDVFALEQSEPFHEILPKITEQGYSRIPVYEDNIDQIVGILFVKDLIPYLDKKVFAWKSVIREAYFIPESKKLDDLLIDFQSSKKHLAIVVNEFGDTSGVITLEDVLEEIIGEISDEFDEEESEYVKVNKFEYLFDGKISLKDFYRIIDAEEEIFENNRNEAESLAGFLIELVDRFPNVGETIDFDNYQFIITESDNRKISKVKLIINPDENHEKNN